MSIEFQWLIEKFRKPYLTACGSPQKRFALTIERSLEEKSQIEVIVCALQHIVNVTAPVAVRVWLFVKKKMVGNFRQSNGQIVSIENTNLTSS